MLLQTCDTKAAAATKEAATKGDDTKEAGTKEAVLATGHVIQRKGRHKGVNWRCSVVKK